MTETTETTTQVSISTTATTPETPSVTQTVAPPVVPPAPPLSASNLKKFAIDYLFFLEHWRHFAAYVYLIICLFDFMIMPILGFLYHSTGDVSMVKIISTLPQPSQVDVLKTLVTKHAWEPVTIKAAGIFHISFGAILGVAAYARGKDKGSDS